MSNSFTMYLSPFTVSYPFTIHRAGVLHGKRKTVNVWKMVNGERLRIFGVMP